MGSPYLELVIWTDIWIGRIWRDASQIQAMALAQFANLVGWHGQGGLKGCFNAL